MKVIFSWEWGVCVCDLNIVLHRRSLTSRWRKETVGKYLREGFRSQDMVDLKSFLGTWKNCCFLVVLYCRRDLCFLSRWRNWTGWKSWGSRGRGMQLTNRNKESTASTSNFRIFSTRQFPLIWSHWSLLQVLHLKKEVTKCVHFKSADESLTLIPEEQFFKEVISLLK